MLTGTESEYPAYSWGKVIALYHLKVQMIFSLKESAITVLGTRLATTWKYTSIITALLTSFGKKKKPLSS